MTINNALVVGGGSAGTAAAILLARGGIAVDLVEINPKATALGSGIALHGNGLRVLETLGVLDACLEQGYPFDTVAIRAPDPQATVLAELDAFRTGGPDLPAALGMYRPDLARILVSAAEAAGAVLHFATTIEAMEQDGCGVDVRFSDQSSGRCDVVIGADGARSRTRHLLGVTPRDQYHGPWDAIREGMVDPTTIHYAALESHLLDSPWNRGRIVLIGDAAHVIPPTLVQGAAIALEDAAVLAQMLLGCQAVDDELWTGSVPVGRTGCGRSSTGRSSCADGRSVRGTATSRR